MMLGTIERLISLLDADGIRYCHWKSNWTLARTLEGDTDLDLLIHPEDAARFREVLKDLGFKPSFETGIKELGGVEHRHALDEETGRLVHIHAYERIVTGESLAKNYELPIAEQILGTVRRQSGMPIPSAGAALIVFMLRMLIKHTTAVELALVMRDRRSFEAEVKWLMSEAALAEALELLPTWFSSIEPDLFIDAYRALEGPGPLWRRVVVDDRRGNQAGLCVDRNGRGVADLGIDQCDRKDFIAFRQLVVEHLERKSEAGVDVRSAGER